MSDHAEVRCADCGLVLGEQYAPGEGLKLFAKHQPTCQGTAPEALERIRAADISECGNPNGDRQFRLRARAALDGQHHAMNGAWL